ISHAHTRAPAAPRTREMASPSPCPAPVTVTTLPATSCRCIYFPFFPLLIHGLARAAGHSQAAFRPRFHVLLKMDDWLLVRHDLLLDQMGQHMKNMQLDFLDAGCFVRRNDNVDIGQLGGRPSLPAEKTDTEHFPLPC